MNWSPYQETIFRFIELEDGSCVIIAVAGSGKTSVIVEGANHVPHGLRVRFVAFNKPIAEELGRRLPVHVPAQTLNSMGHRALIKYLDARYIKVEGRKTWGIIGELMAPDQQRMYGQGVKKLVSIAKAHGLVPRRMEGSAIGLMVDTEQNWVDLMEKYDIEFDGKSDPLQGVKYARKVLRESIKIGQQIIDFDDQLYLPTIWQAKFEPNDVLFVDEAQDVNAIQRAMLKMSLVPGGRLIAVGDPCQPTGTLVSVMQHKADRWNGEIVVQKPIEDIAVGDLVVSLRSNDRQYTKGRRILGISSRRFVGTLITIKTASGLESSYTPNHHCIASFEPHRSKHCVYLMRKNGQVRIGRSKLDYGHSGCGPVRRLTAEGADGVWILSLHNTVDEACINEQVISAQFGLPQLMFTPKNNSLRFDKSLLALAWEQIGDNWIKGIECLIAHGRDPAYPLFEKHHIKQRTLKRPMTVHAGNLMDGCLILPYRGTHSARRKDWETIVIRQRHYVGLVWSMTVEKDHTYVGDGIVTHNCQAIYGFRGADTEAIANIKAEFGAKELPLSVSYRCPRRVVAEAHQYVSHIQPSDTAIEGIVNYLPRFGPDTFTPKDAIVCRNTAPLIELAMSLLREGRPCKVLGREIGQGLIRLITQMGDCLTLEELELALARHLDRETMKLLAKGKEEQAAMLEDRVMSINMFINRMPENQRTVDDLVAWINKIFADNSNGLLTLATVHKAKGMEWPHVYILEPKLMPSKYARQQWQIEQENNVAYVAITRAKEQLTYIDLKGYML